MTVELLGSAAAIAGFFLGATAAHVFLEGVLDADGSLMELSSLDLARMAFKAETDVYTNM